VRQKCWCFSLPLTSFQLKLVVMLLHWWQLKLWFHLWFSLWLNAVVPRKSLYYFSRKLTKEKYTLDTLVTSYSGWNRVSLFITTDYSLFYSIRLTGPVSCYWAAPLTLVFVVSWSDSTGSLAILYSLDYFSMYHCIHWLFCFLASLHNCLNHC
jgi:hypothetical protein